MMTPSNSTRSTISVSQIKQATCLVQKKESRFAGMFEVNDQRQFSNPSRGIAARALRETFANMRVSTNEYRGGNAPIRSRFVLRRGLAIVPSLTHVAAGHDAEKSCS